MSILNIVSTIKKMAVKEIGDSIYENYHRQIGLTKENRKNNCQKKKLQLHATKLIEKMIVKKKNCNCLQQS